MMAHRTIRRAVTGPFLVALAAAFAAAFAMTGPARAQEGQPPLCSLMTTHRPAAGVNYRPGVDVRGRPVVPADLDAPVTPAIPDVMRVPLTIDLAQRFHGNLPAGMEMDAAVGMLDIHRDGRVTYNGRDLTDRARTICGLAPPAGGVVPDAAAAPQALTGPGEAAPPVTPPAQDDVIFGEGQ